MHKVPLILMTVLIAGADAAEDAKPSVKTERRLTRTEVLDEVRQISLMGYRLRDPDVRADVGIGPRTRPAARMAANRIQAANKRAFLDLRGISSRTPANKILKDFQAEVDKHLAFLKPSQRKRLHQIVVQKSGVTWFLSLEAQRELKLAKEQRSNIKKRIEKGVGIATPRKPNPSKIRDPKARRKAIREMMELSKKRQKKLLLEVLKILKPKQKEGYEKLIGKPF